MAYEIRKLSPELVIDYLTFFDKEKHSDYLEEHKCYCVCWAEDDHTFGLERMSTASKRRELAKEYVEKGLIQGYLAYDGNRVIGWCNANETSKCTKCISWIRTMSDIDAKEKVKSIFCFVVAEDYRRKGVATQLLERVCSDAKAEGYDSVEAYPKRQMKNMDDFEGPLLMYIKQGFVNTSELAESIYMAKKLH